ncbi:hypothetical protein [Amycolatopsis regifaucium]|uniref:DUF1579 domain-containing protein n=1 Tax=Amycolatopsis regifaucium TaxID=546365 RepID=A0A154M5F5_9PSEU|nr:hypothetical protein [Amycolatopsis regifaucium]KZB79845.1 hypothetical protein AVL48_15820 [Amycolatopsis regifaucium]OKA09838.1 hypothetical protein ATP06_0205590 [Amycolatopsis regifaucium]SFJ33902.1 hypothetical protein SAMN04489731_11938 [Amycolatopsis regifaucium]
MDVTERIAAVFTATGPRPELAARLSVFEPLIGSWDLVVHNYGEDGSVRTVDGEWHFGWALDGRAVTDVWICPARASRVDGVDGEWGMSLRFYDEKIDAFRSTWLGPGNGWVLPFLGKRTEDGFEIESDTGGVRRRWIFSELTAESFSWRAEETLPDEDPFVRQRFEATRAISG